MKDGARKKLKKLSKKREQAVASRAEVDSETPLATEDLHRQTTELPESHDVVPPEIGVTENDDETDEEELELRALMQRMSNRFLTKLKGEEKHNFYALQSAAQGLSKPPKNLRKDSADQERKAERKKNAEWLEDVKSGKKGLKRPRDDSAQMEDPTRRPSKQKGTMQNLQRAADGQPRVTNQQPSHGKAKGTGTAPRRDEPPVASAAPSKPPKKQKQKGGLFAPDDSLWDD